MLKKAAQRLLIIIPAVWLLASAVFLISKTIPSSASELQFAQSMENAGSIAKAETRKRAYLQMLHRTGEDLPVFYFRIGTAAEPDSLSRIFPETNRAALKKLIHTYGNWPHIAAYYQTWQQFRQVLATQNLPIQTRRESLNLLSQLLKETDPVRMEGIVQALKKTLCFSSEKPVCRQLVLLQHQAENIIRNKRTASNLLPRLFWHGTQNQYHRWFRQLLQGNLGFSNRDMRPVSEIIAEAFYITLWLALATFTLVALSGPAIAIVLSRKSAAKFRNSILNSLYILESIPLFIVALAGLSAASYWGLFGSYPEETGLWLAIGVLTLVNLPYFSSQAYTALQNELRQQYILTAKAKGLSETAQLTHAFRNSLLPYITLLADFLPALLAGAVVLEVIFSLPGMGHLLVDAVLSRDYAVITALVLLTGILKMVSHVLSDIFYNLADPRVSV